MENYYLLIFIITSDIRPQGLRKGAKGVMSNNNVVILISGSLLLRLLLRRSTRSMDGDDLDGHVS